MLLKISQHGQRLAVRLLFRPSFTVALVLGTLLALIDGAEAVTGNANDRMLHAAGFAGLAFLLDYSCPAPAAAYWRWQLPALLLYGILIEIIQGFLPHRLADLYDAAAGLAGLLAYGAMRPLLARIWRPRWLPT